MKHDALLVRGHREKPGKDQETRANSRIRLRQRRNARADRVTGSARCPGESTATLKNGFTGPQRKQGRRGPRQAGGVQ